MKPVRLQARVGRLLDRTPRGGHLSVALLVGSQTALALRWEEGPHDVDEPPATWLKRSLRGVATPTLQSETKVSFSEGSS